MTTLLAIESSTDACSVALCCNTMIQETFVIKPREHNTIMLPMIQELLQSSRLTCADLDAIAFGAGPGSFTGLRLSAGIAQGLAYAAQKPVIPISSLAALALSVGEKINNPSPLTILVALDARMQDIYFGAYRYEHGNLLALCEDALLSTTNLAEKIKKYTDTGDVLKVGGGWVETSLHAHPHAKAVLTLAQADFQAGKLLSAEQALPSYLRDTISWQKWQPKSGLTTSLLPR